MISSQSAHSGSLLHRYTGMVRQTTPYCDVNNGGYLWMNVDSAYISWSMIPHTTKYRRRVSPCSDVWIVSYPPYPHRKILEKCHFVNIYVDKSSAYPRVILNLGPTYPHTYSQLWKTTYM